MKNKAYIIAIAGVETYMIEYVCASEDTARRRFKEVKVGMLQEWIESLMFEINEYSKGEGIYAIIKTKKQYLDHALKDSKRHLKIISDSTFEKSANSISLKPVCYIYPLDP